MQINCIWLNGIISIRNKQQTINLMTLKNRYIGKKSEDIARSMKVVAYDIFLHLQIADNKIQQIWNKTWLLFNYYHDMCWLEIYRYWNKEPRNYFNPRIEESQSLKHSASDN